LIQLTGGEAVVFANSNRAWGKHQWFVGLNGIGANAQKFMYLGVELIKLHGTRGTR
jgi:hypothetical protein